MHVSTLKCNFQFLSKAGATALRWMGAWHASGTEKKRAWLEQTHGVKSSTQENGT